jgi:hypothetical protein
VDFHQKNNQPKQLPGQSSWLSFVFLQSVDKKRKKKTSVIISFQNIPSCGRVNRREKLTYCLLLHAVVRELLFIIIRQFLE